MRTFRNLSLVFTLMVSVILTSCTQGYSGHRTADNKSVKHVDPGLEQSVVDNNQYAICRALDQTGITTYVLISDYKYQSVLKDGDIVKIDPESHLIKYDGSAIVTLDIPEPPTLRAKGSNYTIVRLPGTITSDLNNNPTQAVKDEQIHTIQRE